MERNRDLRRATVSTVNGLPRRRQRITSLRDSTDEDRQMELQETVRLRDRERLQKKDRDREFPKRRRVDRSGVQQRSGGGGESYRENDSTDSSHEEYYEEEEASIRQQNRMNQLSPTSSSLSNNRRGLRTLRSSPVLRAAADEILGVPIPRRARSASAKKLHEYWNSGSGGFGEDLSHRRFSPSPATVSLIGSGGSSPPPSGASMKKKMKSVEPRTRFLSSASHSIPSSVIQDEIEIEVAEALFDLMKQSQSQSQSSQKQEKVEGDCTDTADDELKRLKAADGKDGYNAFSVQNEQSTKVNAETIVVDSMKELKKEGKMEKEKFPDDTPQELVSGDGFLNKVKVGSPKENESPSYVKVNACDIQDPTVTKAAYETIGVEAKKEAKLEIDLMAPPPLTSPERDALVDIATDPKVIIRDVQKKIETMPKNGPLAVAFQMQEEKIGVISSNKVPNLDLAKRKHDTLSANDSTTQQQQARREQKNQSPPSLVPFPIGMSSWAGVLPPSGYMPPLQAVLTTDGSARSSMTMQPPQFKFSQPRPKRCATHQHIAHNIHYHQQLIKKSLSSGATLPATLYGTKPLNLKSMLSTKKFIPGNPFLGEFQGGHNLATVSGGSGKDKNSDAAAASKVTSDKPVLPQTSHQAPTNNILHGPGFAFPLGHHRTTTMAPANSSGTPQTSSAVSNTYLPSNSAGGPSVNLPLPGGSAVSFNHPMIPSNDAATYMAVLQNNGCPIPISTNIAMPPFKGGPTTMPFFNSPFYSSPVFNVTQNQPQLPLPHAPVQSTCQNTSTFSGSLSHKQPQQSSTKISDNKAPTSVTSHPSQPEKILQPSHSSNKSDTEISRKSGASLADGLVSHSVKPNNAQTGSFPVQPMNFSVIPPGAVGNKHGDPPQQGCKGRVDLIPQTFALSYGTNCSTTQVLNFSSMVQNSAIFQMLPDVARNGNQTAHQKNFQACEGKFPTSGGQSFNFSKSDCSDMSGLTTTGAPKFDGLARTVNYLPSSMTGSQPFQSSSAGASVTIPNFQHQQQQLIQLQKNHSHQMQLTGAPPVKASSTSNGISSSFLTGSNFPSNNLVFPQVPIQTDKSSFPPQWENFPRTTAAPEGSSSQSATSSFVSIPQLKTSQSQTHITFGNSSALPASLQGQQQVFIKSQPISPLVVGTPCNPSVSKSISKAVSSSASALPSQETEASPNGPNQKSSPACRRNVPSILSTCPSQLSELKY